MLEEEYNFREEDIAQEISIVDLPILTSARTSKTVKDFFLTNKHSLGSPIYKTGSKSSLFEAEPHF